MILSPPVITVVALSRRHSKGPRLPFIFGCFPSGPPRFSSLHCQVARTYILHVGEHVDTGAPCRRNVKRGAGSLLAAGMANERNPIFVPQHPIRSVSNTEESRGENLLLRDGGLVAYSLPVPGAPNPDPRITIRTTEVLPELVALHVHPRSDH